MIISVIGGENVSDDLVAAAEDIGRELARRDVTVCCGGRGGIMLAVCRGARSQGGHTIGIMPGHDAAESPPNEFVEFPVFTGLGFARNSVVVLTADAVIAIDGAYGTLSELAFALIHGVPIVGLHTWDFAYPGFDGNLIARVDTPAEAVDKAIELAKRRGKRAAGPK